MLIYVVHLELQFSINFDTYVQMCMRMQFAPEPAFLLSLNFLIFRSFSLLKVTGDVNNRWYFCKSDFNGCLLAFEPSVGTIIESYHQ